MNGTLGDYLYGQSPTDRGFLRAIGLSYRDFTAIVRQAGNDDAKVLKLLQSRCADGLELVRRWSERLSQRNRTFLFLLDLDDGYTSIRSHALNSFIRFSLGVYARYLRFHWPTTAALIGLEIETQHAGIKAEAARGSDEEPYRWLTSQRLDYAWKALLSFVLIVFIFNYVIQFLQRLGPVFLVIIAAIFFAYLIYPVVRWLNRRLPLVLCILVVYAAIAGIVVAGLMYLIPAISAEVTTLVHDWPSIQAKIVDSVTNPHNKILAGTPPALRDELAKLPSAIIAWIQMHGAAAAGNAFMVLIGTAAFIASCVAVPVLAAYLLSDSEGAKRFFLGFIPVRRRESTLQLLSELEQVVGGFIRGQILVGVTVGILIAIGLMFVGEPYAILIGVIAGALDFIPYIGPVIAAIPAFTLAFVAGGFPLAVKVAIVFVAANQIEGHLIAPNIVGRTIQLGPSVVFVAILVGAELYGVMGMFIAVPVVGIIRVLLLHLIPGPVSRDEAKPVLTKDPHDATEEAAAS